jgi:hypothetical protein
MKKLFATRKRRTWTLGIAAAFAGLLLFGASSLDSWRSAQYGYYNVGIQSYGAGDHICAKGEQENCVDIDMTLKLFNASMQHYMRQTRQPTLSEQFLLPGPSRELAALSALHSGIMLIMKQKPEDAIKVLKMAIVLADVPDEEVDMTRMLTDPEYRRAINDQARLRAIKLTAQYDLELLFKKNPSQAQQQGKGNPQKGDKPGQPDQGKQDPSQDPTDKAGKGNRDAI